MLPVTLFILLFSDVDKLLTEYLAEFIFLPNFLKSSSNESKPLSILYSISSIASATPVFISSSIKSCLSDKVLKDLFNLLNLLDTLDDTFEGIPTIFL